MLSAYLVAFTMLASCGLVALTFIKVIDTFDGPEQPVETTSDVHAHAA